MTALADYGAHWLWLDRWGDRAGLLVRLIGIEVPSGAALGTLLGALIGGSEGWIERLALRMSAASRVDRLDALRASRLVAMALPGLICIARLLFSGGTTSRLPARGALMVLALTALVLGSWLVAYLAQRLESTTRQRPDARRRLALLAAAAAFALAKLNQWFLPRLYEYLHAALALATFLLFMGAAWMLLSPRARTSSAPKATRPIALALLGGSTVAMLMLAATLARLDRNQNVRVALLDPNVPHSRAVMQALAPWVIEPAQRRATVAARAKARLARAQRTRPAHTSGPVLDDAHILFVTIDALRADHLGTYGYRRPTSPHLDRLAQDAVVFERAYAPAPHSSFSLCSLMASEYLHETLDLGHPVPPHTLASVLGDAGYHTAAFYTGGIFHTEAARLEPYERDAFGFAFHDQVKYAAEALTDRVLQEVDRTVARGEPNSFFWVHYFDVHEPYQDTHFGSADMDRYDSEIRRVDAQLERLIGELRRRLSRDVIVVISADHGEEFYEHGGVYHGSSLYDEQIRIPLIVQAPGLPPRRIATPVESIDLAPTLLEWVGLPAPSSMRGDDLRALALGRGQARSPVFAAVNHKKMVVEWPYKLIADLRFGLFELYDLAHDPHERENLADSRPGELAALRSQIYAWLDSLAPAIAGASGATEIALEWGRLGDRRAVEPLSQLLMSRQGTTDSRSEAARMLGHLADQRAAESLRAGMSDPDPRVAAEAAIALGRMHDPRARSALSRLVASEDAALRVRAAVSLGRLHDLRAVPALLDALWIAPSDYERQEAVRWLGRLRDRRALEPLIHLLPEMRTRYLVPIALGMIGDARAYDALTEVLTWDKHADVRDATVQGLGLLGDPRAIRLIAPLAAGDTTLKFTTESLVRLGAIRRGAIGGADLLAETSAHDFASCHQGPLVQDWDYLHRTWCITRRSDAAFPLAVPSAIASSHHGSLAVLSIRRADANTAAALHVSIGSVALEPIQVDGAWREYHWQIPAGSLPAARVQAQLASSTGNARFSVDHLLLIPHDAVVLARH